MFLACFEVSHSCACEGSSNLALIGSSKSIQCMCDDNFLDADFSCEVEPEPQVSLDMDGVLAEGTKEEGDVAELERDNIAKDEVEEPAGAGELADSDLPDFDAGTMEGPLVAPPEDVKNESTGEALECVAKTGELSGADLADSALVESGALTAHDLTKPDVVKIDSDVEVKQGIVEILDEEQSSERRPDRVHATESAPTREEILATKLHLEKGLQENMSRNADLADRVAAHTPALGAIRHKVLLIKHELTSHIDMADGNVWRALWDVAQYGQRKQGAMIEAVLQEHLSRSAWSKYWTYKSFEDAVKGIKAALGELEGPWKEMQKCTARGKHKLVWNTSLASVALPNREEFLAVYHGGREKEKAAWKEKWLSQSWNTSPADAPQPSWDDRHSSNATGSGTQDYDSWGKWGSAPATVQVDEQKNHDQGSQTMDDEESDDGDTDDDDDDNDEENESERVSHLENRSNRATYFQWERFGLLETLERRAKARARGAAAPWIKGTACNYAKRQKTDHEEKREPEPDMNRNLARVTAPWRP
eukprot:237056-Amphidinium_carterae.1